MKKMIIGLLALVSLSAFASSSQDSNVSKVEAIALKYATGKDIKVQVVETSEGFCGGEGPAYLATVSVRTFERTMNEKEEMELATVWKEIRTYGILASDLAAGSKSLMAEDQCLE